MMDRERVGFRMSLRPAREAGTRPAVSTLALAAGLMLAGGWLALEWFNYAASRYALSMFFGDLAADGPPWATLLALGLWLADLSGLLYLAVPDEREKPAFWYALAAWLLLSAANALLKWLAASWALLDSPMAQAAAAGRKELAKALIPYIPTIVAGSVWVGRATLAVTVTGLLYPVLLDLSRTIGGWLEHQAAPTTPPHARAEHLTPRR